MIKKLVIAIIGLVVVVIVGGALAYLMTAPEPPPEDSAAAIWLAPGAYAIATQEIEFVDSSRPTQANNDYPGASSRTLKSTLWYPTETTGKRPLVVYSHGFMSNRTGGTYVAEALASQGYVVVAPDFPLSNGGAPGGPLPTDVIHQPGDVSYLIDVLLRGDVELPIEGIDEARIGATGLSLGGLTSTLAGYHPRWRDPRIAAVVSIAGPAYMFSNEFFAHGDAPFLMIAGTIDAIVPYPENASVIPERVVGGGLVSIEGGSHVGFADIAEPFMRFSSNPDGLGCDALVSGDAPPLETNPFVVVGEASEGVIFPADEPRLCAIYPLPEAMHPGRQQMINQMAVVTFFESHFAADPARRGAANAAWRVGLEESFPGDVAVRF